MLLRGKDMTTSNLSETNNDRKVGLLLGIGIFVLPYIFSWFTLKKGHSTKAKVVSFSWMAFTLLLMSLSGNNNRTGTQNVDVATTKIADKVATPEKQSALPSSETVENKYRFQGIDFGIRLSDLVKQKKCNNLVEIPQESKEIKNMFCSDLSFNNKKIPAWFYFFNEKLVRISIMPGIDQNNLESYAKALSEKYGRPTHLDADELENFDQRKINQADIAWGDGQVILRTVRENDDEQAFVIYSTASYNEEHQKIHSKGLSNSL